MQPRRCSKRVGHRIGFLAVGHAVLIEQISLVGSQKIGVASHPARSPARAMPSAICAMRSLRVMPRTQQLTRTY